MSLPRMGRVDDSATVFKTRQCLPFLKIERTIEESKRSGGLRNTWGISTASVRVPRRGGGFKSRQR
jgi:hypothetical protein